MKNERKKKIISVISASSGAGGTFVAVQLALSIGKREKAVTYIDEPLCRCPRCVSKPSLYHRKGIVDKMHGKGFTDLFKLKYEGKEVCNKANLCRNVNWVIRTPDSPYCEITPEEVGGEYVICNNPAYINKSTVIICVVRAEPSHILAALPKIRNLKENYGLKVIWVVNHCCPQGHVKDLKLVAGIKPDYLFSSQGKETEKTIKELAEYIITLY